MIETTRFERDKEKEADLYLAADRIKIAWKGCIHFTAPRFLEQEVRRILARDPPFTAADVSHRMTPADAMKLLKKLHHLGVVKTVVPETAIAT